jgi:hypothetical protein
MPRSRRHLIEMLVALLLAGSLLLVAYSAIESINEAFTGTTPYVDPNISSFNNFIQLWGLRATQSGLINSEYFPTYQSILNLPPPATGVKKKDFDNQIATTTQMIKVWYVNARYGGNLAQLSAAIDASRPQWTVPSNPKLSVKAGTEDEEAAAAALKAAVDFETSSFFLPTFQYYKVVLDILSKSGQVSKEVAEQQLVDENPDIISMLATYNDLEALKSAPYSESVKYAGALTVLPKSVELYFSTLSYLISRADQAYKMLNSVASGDLVAADAQAAAMGAPPSGLADLQGATPDSLPVAGQGALTELFGDYSEFFVDNLSLGRLSAPLSVALDTIKGEFEKDSKAAANKYMAIAQTRKRLLDKDKPTFDGRLNTAKDIFRRLKELQDQVSQNPDYAGILAGNSRV